MQSTFSIRSSRCMSIGNSIDIPNSHVNVMRFILRCLQSSNPEYLTDTQYILRYEGHEDYGTAIKLKKND